MGKSRSSRAQGKALAPKLPNCLLARVPKSSYKTLIQVLAHCPFVVVQRMTDIYFSMTAKAQSVAQTISESGGKAIAVPGDMLDATHIETLVKKAAEFGEGKIHIIVNNAGYTWDAVIHKVSSDQPSSCPEDVAEGGAVPSLTSNVSRSR